MDDLLNSAPCGFLSFSGDGQLVEVNETLASWLANTPAQLQGQSFKSILSMGGRVFYETQFWPQLQLQGQLEEIYFSLRAKDGVAVPVLANASRRKQAEDVIYDCIFVRMRQREQYENDLLVAKKAAEQANQAKADFLSMMSHELRTPLSAISGFTDIIASEMDGPVTPAQQEDLKCIKRGSDQLLRLINDILNFAHLEREGAEIKIESVDVQATVLEAESLLSLRFQEAGIEYQSDKSAQKIRVLADSGRFQQIILNLLSNAIKFTPRGGRVWISYACFEEQILIQVGDSGCGVSEKHIERIFEPFVQVDRLQIESSQRGVGLGLSICRELARAMNGDLTVTSIVGEGSVFTLSLPRAELTIE